MPFRNFAQCFEILWAFGIAFSPLFAQTNPIKSSTNPVDGVYLVTHAPWLSNFAVVAEKYSDPDISKDQVFRIKKSEIRVLINLINVEIQKKASQEPFMVPMPTGMNAKIPSDKYLFKMVTGKSVQCDILSDSHQEAVFNAIRSFSRFKYKKLYDFITKLLKVKEKKPEKDFPGLRAVS